MPFDVKIWARIAAENLSPKLIIISIERTDNSLRRDIPSRILDSSVRSFFMVFRADSFSEAFKNLSAYPFKRLVRPSMSLAYDFPSAAVRASAARASVIPEKAETTTTGTFNRWSVSFSILIIFVIPSWLPADVPPNLSTSIKILP